MRALTLATCVVLLASCRREKVDPRVVEVTTPLHVTVRVIEFAAEVDCDAAGDLKAELKCRLRRAPRAGCTYVEAGDDADAPLRRTAAPSMATCDTLPPRRPLLTGTPDKRARIVFDDTGTRAAVLFGDDAWLLYFWEGQLLEARNASLMPTGRGVVSDGAVDWKQVPPLLTVALSHTHRIEPDALMKLVDATPDAQQALDDGVVQALEAGTLRPGDVVWSRLAQRLGERGHQRVRDALLRLVREGSEDALEWAEADESIPREALLAALRVALGDAYASPLLFDALFRLSPDEAALLACREVENYELARESYVEPDDLGAALALIAQHRVKCAWLQPLLLRHACDEALRHEPTEDEAESLGDAPLLSAEEKARVLKHKLMSEDERARVDEAYDDEGRWGPLLLLAAEAQGPLPAEFLQRNRRRTYRRVYRFAGRAELDPCNDTDMAPPEWACRMPLSLTKLERDRCRMELDDVAGTMTLTGLSQAPE